MDIDREERVGRDERDVIEETEELPERSGLEGKDSIDCCSCGRFFNFFQYTVPMAMATGFWSTTNAVPSWLSTWIPREPGYVRPELPLLPHIPPPYSISRLTTADAGAVAALWRTEYGGEDWTWVGGEEALTPYLRDRRVVALGLRFSAARLVATIFAVPFGERTRIGKGLLDNYGFHVVEGLVVHRSLRGRGVAGWMMAAVDGTVSRLYAPRPFACLWARELAVLPTFPTFVSCRPYFWKACEAGTMDGWTRVEAAEAAAWWSTLVEATVGSVIATTSIDARRGGLMILRKGAEGVVVSDTCRATKGGSVLAAAGGAGGASPDFVAGGDIGRAGKPKRIYEVVWASSATAVEAAAAAVTGLLFTTLDRSGVPGWSTGTSGYHAYSIYNYWPPAWGSCDILALREEL